MIGLPRMARQVFDTPHYTLRKGQIEAARLAGKNIILVGECGSGKTEAAYFWLRKSKRRAFYIMPRRVLATQTQERVNEYDERVFGTPRWSVQHSSAREDEQFASSHVVTTIDQVSAKYLALGRFDAIGGSRLMQSDLIIDEVQLMDSTKNLLLLLEILEQTTKFGNHFMLMTATIPDSFIEYFQKNFGCEVIRVKETIHTNQENMLRLVENYPMDEINQYSGKQIIIANTQEEQASILSQIDDPSRVILLNSYLLPSERKEREADAYRYFGKRALESNKILLSTQIIEAGMDISAGRMITSLAPIDSLVQRAGRLNRWGGKGDYFVVSNAFTRIYDEKIIELTKEALVGMNNKHFNWERHMKAVNEVMNDYYKKLLTPRNRKMFALKLKRGGRNELIRDIQQVNLIATDSFEVKDFNRESVSISLGRLFKAKPEKLYRLHRGIVEEITLNEVMVGDTLLIDGRGFHYSELGLRVIENERAHSFPAMNDADVPVLYEDYIEESWLTHARAVEEVAYKRLITDQFITPELMAQDNIQLFKEEENPKTTQALYKVLSQIIGLHDLGKLTKNWQYYIGATDTPMAHRPWEPRPTSVIKNRKHNLISAHALKDVLTPFSQNVLMQHHGRVSLQRGQVQIKKSELIKETSELLNEYGWDKDFLPIVNSWEVRESDLYTPQNSCWGLYLYLLGVCMEADVNGIKQVRLSVLARKMAIL